MTATVEQKEMIDTIVNDCLYVRLRMINRIAGKIYDDALRHEGIKATQLTVLAAVAAFGTTTSKQLSRLLYMDTSSFSRTLCILKKNNWLDVEPSGEGKVLNIEITVEGLKKLEVAYPAWQEAQAKAIEAIGESTSEKIISTGTEYIAKGMI